jgi:hypothetical protein
VTPVEVILLLIAVTFAGVAIGAALAARRPTVDPVAAQLRALTAVARAREPYVLPKPGRAATSADLTEVLTLLDGPARDSDVVRIARDRLDVIRRGLS